MKKIAAALLVVSGLFQSLTYGVFAEEVNVTIPENQPLVIHVSPNGNDSSSGSEEAPLKTLDGARGKVRKLKAENENTPIEVVFHEGEYLFRNGVTFSKEDSGSENAQITYKAADGENVEFKGSVSLDASKFAPVSDESIYERLPNKSKDRVGEMSLRGYSIETVASYPIGASGKGNNGYSLYLDGARQTLARWPNEGFVSAKEVVDIKNKIVRLETSDITRWGTADVNEIYINGFFKNQYALDRFRLKNINPNERTLQINGTSDCRNQNVRFFFFNFLEELDTPGEWYIDSKTMMLYYYPEFKLSDERLELSVLTEDMITLNQTSYLNFEGIKFSQVCSSVFSITGCYYINFSGNEFREIGRTAIKDTQTNNITYYYDKYVRSGNIEVRNNRFINIYCIAVELTGGYFETLEPSGIVIDNNYFSGMGLDSYTYAPGIKLSGVGGEITHNVMHNAAAVAIIPYGNDIKIMYNEIYDVCREVHDAGAIYAGRNKYRRGVEIAYNYIHDVMMRDKSIGEIVCGIYMDDNLCEWYVHHNIIENTVRGMFAGGGDDSLVYNNIFLNCTVGFRLGWLAPLETLITEAAAYIEPYPVYLEKYPKMADMTKASGIGNQGNEIYDNYFVDARLDVIEQAIGEGAGKNRCDGNISVTKNDAEFTDAENQNYEIKEDSDVLKAIPALAEIDMDKIGNYGEMKDLSFQNDLYKIYPGNGQSGVSSSNVNFKWNRSDVYDSYRFILATDSKMKNVLMDEIVRTNYINVEDVIESGNKTYYWTVEGVDISQNNYENKPTICKPYKFTTAMYDETNKTYLKEALDKADTIIPSLVEGDNPGECVPGSVGEYQKVYDSAMNEYNKKYTTQKNVDNATDALSGWNLEISRLINPGYRDLSLEFDDISKWQLSDNQETTVEDGVLKVRDKFVCLAENIPNYQIMTFSLKPQFANSFMAFTTRHQSYGKIWGGTGYTIIIKKDIIEFQRYKNGSGGIIKVVDNEFIKHDQWCDVEVGTIDYGDGIKVILRVDGKEVLNEYDISGILSGEGKFQIENFNFSAGCVLELKARDKMPVMSDYVITGKLDEVTPVVLDKLDISAPTQGNEIYDINMTLNLSGEGQAIGLRCDDEGNQYKFVLREDYIELQRITDEGTAILGRVKNSNIMSGANTRMQFGAYPTKNGMRVYLYANGAKVFDYTDSYSKHQGTKVMLYDMNNLGIATE